MRRKGKTVPCGPGVRLAQQVAVLGEEGVGRLLVAFQCGQYGAQGGALDPVEDGVLAVQEL